MINHWQFPILIALVCAVIAAPMRLICFFLCDKIVNLNSRWWHAIPLIFGLIVACINYYCGIYSFSGGIHTIQETLSGEITLSYSEVIGRIFNTFLTFISGCAGGLIAPAMAIGTGIGSIFSSIFVEIDGGIFLLIGMTSFLTVFLGEPVAATLIVFESTGQSFHSIPFLLAAAFAALFIRKFIDKIPTKNGK